MSGNQSTNIMSSKQSTNIHVRQSIYKYYVK